MAPFSVPTPCIVPCRVPIFGGPKSIDTKTKIELFCDTELQHEIFYTLDGTKPQPYAGIVQGSKLFKYTKHFCLPAGKITVKAIALHAKIHSIRSNVITKCFEVVKAKSEHVNKISKKEEKKTVFPGVDDDNLIKITEKSSDLIFDEDIKFKRIVYNEADEHSLEDDLMKHDHQYSSGSSIAEDSVEEDRTICDINETSLLEEHGSPVKQYLPEDLLSDHVELNEEENLIELQTTISDIKPQSCQNCSGNLQQCLTCHEMNFITSKYCTHCGTNLKQLCRICNELNLIIATYCQYCGKKLICEDEATNEMFSEIDEMPKKNACIQNSVMTEDKCIQTLPLKMSRHSSPNSPHVLKRNLPSHSPGRGYWHQQLDYICNNLKTYAYNNMEFREKISEPVLSTFQSAEVIKNEDDIMVTITFSPFVIEEAENKRIN